MQRAREPSSQARGAARPQHSARPASAQRLVRRRGFAAALVPSSIAAGEAVGRVRCDAQPAVRSDRCALRIGANAVAPAIRTQRGRRPFGRRPRPLGYATRGSPPTLREGKWVLGWAASSRQSRVVGRRPCRRRPARATHLPVGKRAALRLSGSNRAGPPYRSRGLPAHRRHRRRSYRSCCCLAASGPADHRRWRR